MFKALEGKGKSLDFRRKDQGKSNHATVIITSIIYVVTLLILFFLAKQHNHAVIVTIAIITATLSALFIIAVSVSNIAQFLSPSPSSSAAAAAARPSSPSRQTLSSLIIVRQTNYVQSLSSPQPLRLSSSLKWFDHCDVVHLPHPHPRARRCLLRLLEVVFFF